MTTLSPARLAACARGDDNRRAAAGLPAWLYAHALPYFRKQESWEDGGKYFMALARHHAGKHKSRVG